MRTGKSLAKMLGLSLVLSLMAFTGVASAQSPVTTIPTAVLDDTDVAPGESTGVSAPPGTFQPNSRVTVTLGGETIATLTATSTRALSGRITLPADANCGTNTLGLTGTAANRQPVAFSSSINVTGGSCAAGG